MYIKDTYIFLLRPITNKKQLKSRDVISGHCKFYSTFDSKQNYDNIQRNAEFLWNVNKMAPSDWENLIKTNPWRLH